MEIKDIIRQIEWTREYIKITTNNQSHMDYLDALEANILSNTKEKPSTKYYDDTVLTNIELSFENTSHSR
ncbi:MAG: hypothetical protein SOZ04_04025 [Bacilli bacterium]|nr:hypothetical protein [Bacilli bacterium]